MTSLDQQMKKGMGYGELIVDNIIGLDNEYESFGEKLGKAINEDEIGFLKNAAVGIYEGAKEFVTNPVETTKEVITDNDIFNITNNNKDLNSEVTPILPPTNPQLTSPEPIDDSPEYIEGKFRSIIDVLKSNIKAPLDKFFGNGFTNWRA